MACLPAPLDADRSCLRAVVSDCRRRVQALAPGAPEVALLEQVAHLADSADFLLASLDAPRLEEEDGVLVA